MFLSMASHIASLRKRRLGAYFRLEHSRWENRITFSDIHCFRNFSTGTTLKVEFHLLANRISKKLFVDDKQPDASPCVKCHSSLHPQPVEGEERGGRRNPHGLGNGDG